VGFWAGEHSDEGEESEADADADGRVEKDLLALARRGEGPGTVGTKGNPVCCNVLVVSVSANHESVFDIRCLEPIDERGILGQLRIGN